MNTLFYIYTVNLGNYDYEYTITSIEPNECKIHKFTNPTEPTNLIIPSEINGYTVTAIGENAFKECSNFTGDVVIPSTVDSAIKFISRNTRYINNLKKK